MIGFLLVLITYLLARIFDLLWDIRTSLTEHLNAHNQKGK